MFDIFTILLLLLSYHLICFYIVIIHIKQNILNRHINNKKNHKNIFFLLSSYLLICLFFVIEHYSNKQSANTIPRQIWTYWGGSDVPKTVTKCIDSWKKHNPNYKINLLNDEMIKKLLNSKDIEFINTKKDFIERKSDFIRIMIVYEYGGIWMDSSIFCNEPLTWLPSENYDFVGFTSPQTTNNKMPIIENWFFAAPPKSLLLKDWLEESKFMTKFESENDYVKYVNDDGIDSQGLTLPYLVMHLALLRVTTRNKNKYKIKLFNSIAEDGPFKHLHDAKYNPEKAMQIFKSGEASNQKLVKIRGIDRKFLE